jgi:Trypsin-like peptidase domain
MTRFSPRRIAIAAVAAALLGTAAAQSPFEPPAASAPLDAGVRASLMPRVARLQAAEAGDGQLEEASGFVLDQYKRLVLTSCRILFTDWRKLAITVEFAAVPTVKRTAEPLLCDRALDLAIVRVREFDIEFPRALEPPPPRQTRGGEGLYILGFASGGATIIPATVEVSDAELPGLAGRFIGTRSKLPPSAPGTSDSEEATHHLGDLRGGPLVTPQGKLIGVNAFTSGERIKHPLSGLELATVPKGDYLARTVESIAPFVRAGLALKP